MRLGSMLKFTRDEISPEALTALQSELVIRQVGGEKFGFGKGETLVMYREGPDGIEIPRYYGLRELNGKLEDETVRGAKVEIPFTGKLRESQKPIVAEFLAALAKPGLSQFGGVLNSGCGTGKTVMGLYLISEIGVPALVLVHSEFLMKQWRERISEFLGIGMHEVGWVQRDRCEWRGKKIVLGMVESLIAREYEPEMYQHFGVLVLDEVHRHAASSWHRAMTMFPARVRIGLSATPRRNDGCWNVIRWHVGEVLAKGTSWELKPKVFRIPTGATIPSDMFMMRRGKINLSKLITILTRFETRNNIIVSELVKAIKAGRRVLVLSDRLEHLGVLQRMFVAAYGNSARIGHYVGGVNDEQIEFARTCNLLFGTFQYAKEGLDDPGMDTLFLTVPKGDVEQPVGRILRSNDEKKEPFVIDFVDERTGICVGFAESRRRQYVRLGFDVVTLDAPSLIP